MVGSEGAEDEEEVVDEVVEDVDFGGECFFLGDGVELEFEDALVDFVDFVEEDSELEDLLGVAVLDLVVALVVVLLGLDLLVDLEEGELEGGEEAEVEAFVELVVVEDLLGGGDECVAGLEEDALGELDDLGDGVGVEVVDVGEEVAELAETVDEVLELEDEEVLVIGIVIEFVFGERL